MRQVIPFSKNIVFKTNIASILSISLEHEEKVSDEEISGTFIIFGEYKEHLDTTENKSFKYSLPFSTVYPDNLVKDSIKIDIDNFTYEQIEDDVLRVDISFLLTGDEVLDKVDELIDGFIIDDRDLPLVVEDAPVEETKEEVKEEVKEEEIIKEVEEDYVIYHIHIVKEMDTIESIMKQYEVCLDELKEYNDVSNLKMGDKLIIPSRYE